MLKGRISEDKKKGNLSSPQVLYIHDLALHITCVVPLLKTVVPELDFMSFPNSEHMCLDISIATAGLSRDYTSLCHTSKGNLLLLLCARHVIPELSHIQGLCTLSLQQHHADHAH